MIISIANPIYDAVFKYLMEDNRVAKTVLSALLQREVAEVEMRKHEYTNGTRDKISMFRIDFGAQVRQDDGSLKLVLIELQKTWLETETLRFRQYLGTQYANPDNILKDDNPNTLFVFIAHEDKGQPKGNMAKNIRYDADIKIRVEGYKAFATTRYEDSDKGEGGQDYTIWEQGAREYWAEL